MLHAQQLLPVAGGLSIHIYNGSLYTSNGYLSQLQATLAAGQWFNETVYGTQVGGDEYCCMGRGYSTGGPCM
jgi:hypothetical protein